MAKGLNWNEVNRQASKSGGGAGGGGYRLTIQDGETVALKFLFPDDGSEPFPYKRHYIKDKGYHVCAEDAAEDGDHAGCVFCHEAGKGPVGRIQRVFAFSVFDPRKQHVFKEPVKIPGDEKKTSRFIDCPDDATCKFCRKGDEPKIKGVRHWTQSAKGAQQLRLWALQVLGKTCASCNAGKIKIKGYECPECGEPLEVDDPEEKVRCFECTKQAKKAGKSKGVDVMPKEVLSCSRGCDDARRLDLSDVWVEITRSGADTSTTYNYTRYQGDEPAEVPKDVSPVNFTKSPDFKPKPANEQAAFLGISNPFKGGKKKSRDDDDEDEDDEDDDDIETSDDDDDDDDSSSIFGKKRR